MDKRKPINELRRDLKALMATNAPPPSSLCRSEIEQMLGIYQRVAEMKKELPPPVKQKGGRKPAREVENTTTTEGIEVPKTPKKIEVDYKPKEKKTVKPAKVEDADSGTGSESEAEQEKAKKSQKVVDATPVVKADKPKKTLSEEQKAKMKAGREAKKAESKKETPPPDAPPKETPKGTKLPVFKIMN